MNHKPHNKSTHVYGRPAYKPTVSEIFICHCGSKYLKTRKDQVTCVRCIYKRA